MTRINIKPLSVNEAFQGRRFRTKKYLKYETDLLFMLPKLKMPEPPFEIRLKFGFSSIASDIDNPVKPLLDILSKKYKFNDKLISRSVVEREIVKKGNEFFEFNIDTLT